MSVESRTRSLERISHKMARDPRFIVRKITELLASGGQVRVLEIGFGWGRALLELAWEFRDQDVVFYGVDKERHPAKRSDDLRSIARDYTSIPAADLASLTPPQIFYYDATSLHFVDESIDLVYSAVTIRFIERKAEFLEEVCRILAPGGIGLLHMSERIEFYPYSFVSNSKVLTPFASRFVLKHDRELIPLAVYLKLFDDETFQFDVKRKATIVVTKRNSARLALNLMFNEELSRPMRDLLYRDESGRLEDGARSVYDLRPEMYDMLLERGLLKRDQLRTDTEMVERRGEEG